MNKRIPVTCAAVFLFGTAAFAQSSPAPSPIVSATPAGQKYTCPMHPEVVQDKPGKCPQCGMKLEPKKEEARRNNGLQQTKPTKL